MGLPKTFVFLQETYKDCLKDFGYKVIQIKKSGHNLKLFFLLLLNINPIILPPWMHKKTQEKCGFEVV